MSRTIKPRTALYMTPSMLAILMAPKGRGRVDVDSVAAQMDRLEAIWNRAVFDSVVMGISPTFETSAGAWFTHRSTGGPVSDFEKMMRGMNRTERP